MAADFFIGESLVGEGNEVAHIDLIIGSKSGPTGAAFTQALSNNKDGFSTLLAVVTGGVGWLTLGVAVLALLAALATALVLSGRIAGPVRALAALVASLLLIESLTRLHEPTSKLRKHHALRESGPE